MRLETLPLILGVLVALIGVGFLVDSWMVEDASAPHPDRRRRARAERHQKGEAVLGFGILCMAAALIGRDSWRYSNIAVIVGTVAITFGALLNRVYLRELLMNRGPARRAEVGEEATAPDPPPPTRNSRIR